MSAIFEELISHQTSSSSFRDVLLPEDCPDVKYDDLPHFFANYYNVMLSEMLSWNKIEESKEEGEKLLLDLLSKDRQVGYFDGNTMLVSLL
jgi:hypothetical protein